MLLRTVISVNQFSIYGILAEKYKYRDKLSSEESAPSSDESESSGTLCKRNIGDETIFLGVSVMPENARCSPGGNATIFDTDTSTTSTASTTKSAIRRRRKTSITMSIARLDGGITESHGETRRQHLHLQLRSGRLRNGKRVGAHGDFGFLESIPENRREVQTAPLNTAHAAQYSLFTSAERIARALLKNCSVIFVRMKRFCHLVRTCLALCCSLTCRAPRANLLPHSLFLLPRHQNTHQHTVHHQPLPERPVEKQRHQGPLWRENQRSVGNPRNTFSTGDESTEVATVSRISSVTDPYQLCSAQKEFGEQDQAPITEEVKEFVEIGTHGFPDYLSIYSKITETSYFQSHMHFDDSAENIADSDLEDGELQKMLTSPLYARKASGKPRKRKFEVSFI